MYANCRSRRVLATSPSCNGSMTLPPTPAASSHTEAVRATGTGKIR